MMKCKACDFIVPANLKFAIMKNMCPQCGKHLFSDDEMNHLSMIQSRVFTQTFAENLEEQMVHDIALFIYGEITNGYGRIILDKELSLLLKSKKISEDIEIDPSEVEEILKAEEDYKKRIREEEATKSSSKPRPIPKRKNPDDDYGYSEEEIVEDLNPDEIESFMNSQGSSILDEERIRKLKRLAASNKQANVMVRRVDE